MKKITIEIMGYEYSELSPEAKASVMKSLDHKFYDQYIYSEDGEILARISTSKKVRIKNG